MSTVTYNLDPAHSSARFSVRHMMISHVRGDFSGITSTLTYDPASPESSQVSVEIDVATIHTGQPQRDEHLRTADFFEVDKFPKITFVSTSAKRTSDDEGDLTGDLTIHGATRPVTLHVEGSLQEATDPYGNVRLGFTAHAKIKRSDFGLHYNVAIETGGFVVGDDIDITLDAQYIRQA